MLLAKGPRPKSLANRDNYGLSKLDLLKFLQERGRATGNVAVTLVPQLSDVERVELRAWLDRRAAARLAA